MDTYATSTIAWHVTFLYQHESMNPRISRAVFPDLKNVSSESVANQMTKLIHKHSDPALKERNQS
jgi:hypothetical protein